MGETPGKLHMEGVQFVKICKLLFNMYMMYRNVQDKNGMLIVTFLLQFCSAVSLNCVVKC